MKPYILDIKDISDSKEMLEAQPHFFLSWFGYILLAILIISLTWAYFCEIEEYVKATGSVRPAKKISTIKNIVSGPVEHVNITEGTKVNQGDTLYSIELNSLLIAKEDKLKEIAKLEKEIANLIKLRESVRQEQNLFDLDQNLESDYYNIVEKYLNDLKLNVEQITNSKIELEQVKIDNELSLKLTKNKLEIAQDEYKQLNKLVASVEVEENLFQIGTEYYNRYENYRSYFEKLNSAYQHSKENYRKLERLHLAGGIARMEVEEALKQKELAQLEVDRYRKEYIINLQDSIKQRETNIQELTSSLEKLQSNVDAYNERTQNIELMIEKNRLDMLVQIEDRLRDSKNRLEVLENDLRLLEFNIAEGEVKAPIAGVVNLYTQINQGDLLQSGVEVATIVPDHSDYLMQLMVSNQDIAHIREGQEIKYRFLALPYQEYGELSGKIKTISTDSRLDELSGVSYYLVEATVNQAILESYKGNIAEIKAGMVFEARVITETKKVLVWLLEKLNLRD